MTHLRLLEHKPVVENPSALEQKVKDVILALDLEFAIEGETNEFEQMQPTMVAQTERDRDPQALARLNKKIDNREICRDLQIRRKHCRAARPYEGAQVGAYRQSLPFLTVTGGAAQGSRAVKRAQDVEGLRDDLRLNREVCHWGRF